MTEPLTPEESPLDTLLGELAGDFLHRCQKGETPEVEEYAHQYPQLATVLRQMLPALQLLGGQAPGPGENQLLSTNLKQASLHPRPSMPQAANIEPPPGYEIIHVLGRGGMGIVYKARHIALDRIVALKMIRAGELATEQDHERFHSEALAVARLQHPGIVQIFEVGSHKELPFFSLELVEGGSLAEHLEGKPQEPRLAALQLKAMAQAMNVVHNNGLIHRDLKPANILLTDEGEPKITDFGLVKRLKEPGLTQTGAIVGTPSYLAPEQATGESADVTQKTDIYALGAILYELLTGRPPFNGSSILDTLRQVQNREPIPPRDLQPGCPRDLETICLTCLQKTPARRYHSMAALSEDLQAFLDGRAIQARRVGAIERAWLWAKRRPALAASLLLVMITLAALTGLGARWIYSARLEEANHSLKIAQGKLSTTLGLEQQAREKAESETIRADQAHKIARRSLYFNQLLRSNLEWDAGKVATARQLLHDCPKDLREWEWHYLHRHMHPELDVLSTSQGKPSLPLWLAFNPNGSRIACSTMEQSLLLFDLSTRDKVVVERTAMHLHPIGFGPSPGSIVGLTLGNPPSFSLWDLSPTQDNKKPVRRLRVQCGRVARLSSNGSLLYTLTPYTRPRFVTALSTTNGRQIRSWEPKPRAKAHLALSPNGNRLAAQTEGPPEAIHIAIWETTTEKLLQEIAVPADLGPLKVLQFTTDNNQLLAGFARGVKSWSIENGDEIAHLPIPVQSHNGPVPLSHLTFSPDGKWLAGANQHFIHIINIRKPLLSVLLKGHSQKVSYLLFSPNGRKLASTGFDGAIRLWDLTRYAPLAEAPPIPGARVFDHNGQIIALLAGRGRDRNGKNYSPGAWDVKTREPICTLDPKRRWSRITISPNRQYLATAQAITQRPQRGKPPQRKQRIELWESKTGKLLQTITLNAPTLTQMSFSRDADRLTTVVSPQGNKTDRIALLQQWSTASGKQRLSLRLPRFIHSEAEIKAILQVVSRYRELPGSIRTSFWSIATAGDKKQVAFLSPKRGVEVWSMEAAAPQFTLPRMQDEHTAIAITPNGKRLMTCAGGALRLWSMRTGEQALRLTIRARPKAIHLSPNGQRILVVNELFEAPSAPTRSQEP